MGPHRGAESLLEWFETRARKEVRPYFGAYLSEIANWDEVEFRVGRKGNGKLADRLRVHRQGTGSGGAVYIGLRGKLLFRLPKNTDISSYPFARSRNVHPPHDDYGIDVWLRDHDAVADAVKLTREALDSLA